MDSKSITSDSELLCVAGVLLRISHHWIRWWLRAVIYLILCWPRSIKPYSVIWQQGFNNMLALCAERKRACDDKISLKHDDVIEWKHFSSYWPFVWGIHRSPVNFPHKGQWRRALMFSLSCTWINSWVNNSEAGDLRCHRSHCDVSVMKELKIRLFDTQSFILYDFPLMHTHMWYFLKTSCCSACNIIAHMLIWLILL